MDVQKILAAISCAFILTSCSNSKTADSVFPNNGALGTSACLGQAIQGRFIVQWEDGTVTVESAQNAAEFKRDFIQPRLENIRFVEYDRAIQLEKTIETQASRTSDSWGQSMISAPSLWSQGIAGENIKVAIVDSFVDINHPQLRSRIAINTGEIPNNSIDDDGNGIVDDYYGADFTSTAPLQSTPSSHGTHVAGIIAADSRFGPIEGVAPKAQVIPAQFISNDGGGSLGDAILALRYAASRGAKVINASWGGAPCVSSLQNTFAELEKKDILVVVAAGNDGRDIDYSPEFPASFNISTQITVAASSVSDFMTSWSNSGFQTVHVAAPGERILSTVPQAGTAYMDGTSMAAPFVSGAAALLWSAHPQASALQIKSALLQSVDAIPGREFKVSSRGRINVAKALQILRQSVP